MKIRRSILPTCLLCLLSSALQLFPVSQSSAAGFVPTGSMSNSHAFHATTLLPNGKVLVAGGGYGAELYDPSTGTWTATASMNWGRSGNTATLLPDGKVLEARGYFDVFTGLATAELYDPVAASWTVLGYSGTPGLGHPLLPGGNGHSATLLSNGQVLFVGGYDVINHRVYTPYLYDSTNGTWGGGGLPPEASRLLHTATFLADGRVLVAGGESNGPPISSAILYDPATGVWTNTASMAGARMNHTATLLPNGKVLVAGGDYTYSSAELYDPATGTWTTTGTMNTGRASHTATLLPSGKVLVVGGDANKTSAELYDSATGIWSVAGSLNVARSGHTATLLPNGDVLIAGGAGTSTELYQQYPPLITSQRLAGGDMQFSYLGGMSGTSYVLDRSLSLAPLDWIPQSTNTAFVSGTVLFTNTPVASTNNYWRIRSVP